MDFSGPQASFALTKETQYELGVLNPHLIVEEEAYSTTKKWIADLLSVAPALGERLMGSLDKNLVCGARIRSVWEQEPRFENHGALDSTNSDELGIPRATLHWKKSESDRRTIVVSTNQFAGEIANSEVGRVRVANWVSNDGPIPPQKGQGSWHHMGALE